MMRHFTEEEIKLMDKLHTDKSLNEEDKNRIKNRLSEIEKEQTKNYPFAH